MKENIGLDKHTVTHTHRYPPNIIIGFIIGFLYTHIHLYFTAAVSDHWSVLTTIMILFLYCKAKQYVYLMFLCPQLLRSFQKLKVSLVLVWGQAFVYYGHIGPNKKTFPPFH